MTKEEAGVSREERWKVAVVVVVVVLVEGESLWNVRSEGEKNGRGQRTSE